MNTTGTEPIRAMLALIDAVTTDRSLGLALRLEAFYQHYARFALMEGAEALPRQTWWAGVLRDDPAFVAHVAFERTEHPHDAEGARV